MNVGQVVYGPPGAKYDTLPPTTTVPMPAMQSAPEPGSKCPTCERRLPHPKKEDTPKTRTKSYRVPVDEIEAHNDVLETAARFLGCHERPYWQFQTYSLALALVLQDTTLRGMALRRPRT